MIIIVIISEEFIEEVNHMNGKIQYYCDGNVCHFYHEGWCSYWDTTTELMKIRNKKCSMNSMKDELIDAMMNE